MLRVCADATREQSRLRGVGWTVEERGSGGYLMYCVCGTLYEARDEREQQRRGHPFFFLF